MRCILVAEKTYFLSGEAHCISSGNKNICEIYPALGRRIDKNPFYQAKDRIIRV